VSLSIVVVAAAICTTAVMSVIHPSENAISNASIDDATLSLQETRFALQEESVRSLQRPLELRGRSSSSSSRSSRSGGSVTTSRKKKEGGEFFAGLVLIWLALPMVWMNERKNVKIYQVIQAGQDAVIPADANKPEPENKYALVHMQGRTITHEPVGD